MTTEDTSPTASATAIQRVAQIITQKFQLPAASASIERAKRIFNEMVRPQQLARRRAEAEAEQFRAQVIRLMDELAAAQEKAAKRGET